MTRPQAGDPCPWCATPLYGMATRCWAVVNPATGAECGWTPDAWDGPEPAKARQGGVVGSSRVPDTRSEREIRHAVVKSLRALGYGVWDTEQERKGEGTRCTPGLPDLFVMGGGRTAAVELKSAKGRQTDTQREFQRLWTAHGGTYLIWRSEVEAIAWVQREEAA